MASAGNSTKQVVVKLSVLPSEAIQGIEQARKSLETYINANKQLEAIGQKNSDRYIANEAAIKNLNGVIAQNQKLLQNSIDEQKANGDSLNALRAQLSALLKQYDDLSKAERESAQGTDMLNHIQELTNEIKDIEESTKRFQRSVGGYGEAIQAAMDGTLPMKTAMRQIKQELTELTVKYRESAGLIQGQQQVMEQIAQTQGKESQAYKDAAAEMDTLIQKREEMKSQIDDMTQKAGQLDDAIRDVNASVKNMGTDNAPLVAAKQSADLLVNSYTALHGTLVALGIEDKNLIEIYAKLQIVQKGLNAMTQIYNLLQKESVLRQQLNVLWTNLTTKSLGSLINAKKADAAASVGATAGTTALTAGEVAATGATFTLTGALNALKVAIMNIPVIGWILAAIAALGTLIGLVVRANKSSDDGRKIKDAILATDNERIKALSEIDRKQAQIAGNIRKQADALADLDPNSRAYKDNLSEVAKYLGVSEEYLKKNLDKVGAMTEAQEELNKATEKYEENQKKILENEQKKEDITRDVNDAIRLGWDAANEQLDKLQSEYNLTDNQLKNIHKIRKKLIKQKITSAEADRLINAELQSQISSYNTLISQINTENKGLEQTRKNAAAIVDAYQTESDNTTKKKTNGGTDNAKERRKKELEERRKTEDMELKMVKEGLERQLREYRLSISRQIEDLKERLKTEKNLTTKAKEEINRQIVLLTARGVDEEMKIRQKYNDDYIKSQLNVWKAYYKSVQDAFPKDSPEQLSATIEMMKLQYNEAVKSLDASMTEINKKYNEITEIGLKSGEERRKMLESMGLTEEEFQKLYTDTVNTWEQSMSTYNQTLTNMESAYNQQVTKVKMEFADSAKETQQKIVDTVMNTDWQKWLNEIEVSDFQDKEIRKAQIAQEQAERRVQLAKDEASRISSYTEEEYMALYGSESEWQLAMAEAMQKVVEAEGNLQGAIQNTAAAIKDQKKQMVDAGMKIGDAMANTAGSLNQLFNTLAENNEKYADFATAMAMMQILISSAVSIAQAIAGATEAAAAGGPAAPILLAAYIVEMVGIVAGGIASAVSTLKQAKEAKQSAPKFASGGLITEGGDRTGKKDTVHIMASTGEYIIKKKAVDNVGVDFLDRINNFDGRHVSHKSGYYAVGGEIAAGIATADEAISYEKIKASFAEALQEMPNPVVSVKEITNKQKRVAVKDTIAKQ